jgi:hypothetical protein
LTFSEIIKKKSPRNLPQLATVALEPIFLFIIYVSASSSFAAKKLRHLFVFGEARMGGKQSRAPPPNHGIAKDAAAVG